MQHAVSILAEPQAGQGTATSVRLALEAWRRIEEEDQGLKLADHRNKTKRQRADAIRWNLMQLAHPSAHTVAEQWTRDDAVRLLCTLCSLLAVREP